MNMKFNKAYRILLWVLYGISGFFPRSERRWVFGDRSNNFSDNTKYLFIYLKENEPEIDAAWITDNSALISYLKSNHFKVYRRYSFRGIFFCLTAKYYFYNHHLDDINFWVSRGSVAVNLWHGTPLKVIEFDIQEGPLARIYHEKSGMFYYFNHIFNPHMYARPDYCVAPTKEIADIFSGAFRMNRDNIILSGYPRNDILNVPAHDLIRHVNKYENRELSLLIEKLKDYEKVFIYMPTWRDCGNSLMEKSLLDLERINDRLVEKNRLLLIKLHPKTVVDVNDKHSNVVIIKNNVDMYPLLPFTDCLITDYSSIYFDYMDLNKKIVFYCYDLKDYTDNNRRLYFDYNEVTPGEKIYDMEDLLRVMGEDTVIEGNEDMHIMGKFVNEARGGYCRKIVDYFRSNAA
jgi:teichoic acid glycerol-phosphate transferase